ncbi:hypothetical protein RPK59_00550 [Salmonella enterica]|nr:hypothetical protein [Salmonella enterica]MEA1440395.1 hypothetical protein [Salmonella enterica]
MSIMILAMISTIQENK